MTTPASSWKFEIEYNSCAADQISVAFFQGVSCSRPPNSSSLQQCGDKAPRNPLQQRKHTWQIHPTKWLVETGSSFCCWIMMFHQPGNSETKEKSQQTYSLVTAPGASPQFTQTHRKLGKIYGSSFILHAVPASTHLWVHLQSQAWRYWQANRQKQKEPAQPSHPQEPRMKVNWWRSVNRHSCWLPCMEKQAHESRASSIQCMVRPNPTPQPSLTHQQPPIGSPSLGLDTTAAFAAKFKSWRQFPVKTMRWHMSLQHSNTSLLDKKLATKKI